MLITSIAKLRFVSIPPKKMRLVANEIKGLPVQRALDVLNFTPRIAAQHIARTVKSAAANALSQEGTDRLKPEDLVVKSICVDAAPTQKRIRFQSMGRVFRYRKRFCHLTVLLEGEMDTEEASRATRKTKASPRKSKPSVKPADEAQASPKKKTSPKKAAPKKAAPKKTKPSTKKAAKADEKEKGK